MKPFILHRFWVLHGIKNLQRQYAPYGTRVEILKDEKEFIVKLPFVGGDVNRFNTIYFSSRRRIWKRVVCP